MNSFKCKINRIFFFPFIALVIISMAGAGIAFASTGIVKLTTPDLDPAVGNFSVNVNYTTDDEGKTGGLNLYIFFDSSKVSYVDYDADTLVTSNNVNGTVAPTLMDATALAALQGVDDDNADTDSAVFISWVHDAGPPTFTASWPEGVTLPADLVTLNFTLNTQSTCLNLYSTSTDDLTGLSLNGANCGNIVDTTPPVITLVGAATVKICQDAAYTDAGATASDDVDGDITANIVKTGEVDTATPADYTITYNVSDAATNAATEVTRTVTVVPTASCDTEAPVITLTGEATVDVCLNAAYADAGATASDNVDGDITANIVKVGTVDTATAGTYTITYNVSDAFGNPAAEVTRTVIVAECTPVDKTPPEITLTGSATVNVCLNAAYTDAGATASDNKDGDITANIVKAGTVDTSTAGTYTITYNVSDAAENPATEVTRTVIVAECTTVTLGDADGNGTVNIFDALLVAKYDVKMVTDADINLVNANADCVDPVNINDALKIAQYDVGLIAELVCE